MTATPPERPAADAVPSPETVGADRGIVFWHRDGLRTADHPALAAGLERGDALVPLFVFDPAFYEDGLACDSRLGFLHDCLADLDAQYRARTDGRAGLTCAHGDPVAVLTRFADAGWDILAAASPTGRYGKRRDERARKQCAVTFISGDGLVRGTDRTREDWQAHIEAWLTADQAEWPAEPAAVHDIDTGVMLADIEQWYPLAPEKQQVPTGGTTAARERLAAFDSREYPGNISAPQDAREGTSGLSPYLSFGCLSVRQVYQHIRSEHPDCRGREMFVSRLFWNRHYKQKLADWPGWLDRAVNPVFEKFNADRHDPDLVAAWKQGATGYPLVDASMRCLRETGWLNFRMRAMCASFYYHVLQQPWWLGADWYYYHLVDADAALNYTQWQCQCGLVGRPTLRLYNPRKQVRDQDPDGEFITRWVPELADLPPAFLDRPEATPLHVQAECGVEIGDDYPHPVVDFERRRELFWDRFDALKGQAAARLGDEAIARRASLSGGLATAREIAAEHGDSDATTSQTDLTSF